MNLAFLGMAAALGLSAAGSAFGAGFAGMSSVGAWKKCYASGKPAPFIMIAFTGAPLTQTIYGFLLMNFIRSSNCDAGMALGIGIFCGIAIGLSALFQGKLIQLTVTELNNNQHNNRGARKGIPVCVYQLIKDRKLRQRNSSISRTVIQHITATPRSLTPAHAAIIPAMKAAAPAAGDCVASTMAGKVITARVT